MEEHVKWHHEVKMSQIQNAEDSMEEWTSFSNKSEKTKK